MIKVILLSIGLVLVFEGSIYFLFAKKLKDMFEIINSLEPEKIRFFSSVLIIIGLCLIYFTFKIYKL
jgi:uncharacterized protein YjeT (DUF2065 family)